jgi:hypothetical protein
VGKLSIRGKGKHTQTYFVELKVSRLILINIPCSIIEVVFFPCTYEMFESKCREEIQKPFFKPSLTVKDMVYGSRTVIVKQVKLVMSSLEITLKLFKVVLIKGLFAPGEIF